MTGHITRQSNLLERRGATRRRLNAPLILDSFYQDRSRRRLQVYYLKVHVAETAPFRAPPLDLDENEHAIRRISTPLITMGLFSRKHPFRLTDLV